MKHLFNFDTVAEYDAVKDTLEKPYIVTIDENGGLQYNTDVIRVPEGSETIVDDMLYVGVAKLADYDHDDVKDACINAALIKIIVEGVTCIVPAGAANTSGVIGTDNVLAFAYHANDPVIVPGLSEAAGIEEIKTLQDFYKATFNRARYITKEEFYLL